MTNAFEKILEKHFPELNILTSAGADIQPGTILESQKKDVVAGYLPNCIRDEEFTSRLTTRECPYQMLPVSLHGLTTSSGALEIMKMLGLNFKSRKNYRIGLDIQGVTSLVFDNNIGKIDFERIIRKMVREDKGTFKLINNHFLVLRTVYAKEFRVTVEEELNGSFEADTRLNDIDYKGNASFEKKENAILVSNNTEIPFGVVCFKITRGGLKEKDR